MRIRPDLGDLASAEGTVPTPLGPIHMRWERRGSGLRGYIHLPAGITGEARVDGPAHHVVAPTPGDNPINA